MIAMRTRLVGTLLAFVASAAMGQSFSPDQQAVIDQLLRCHDGWSAAVAEKRLERFTDVCPHTESALWWYTDIEQPGTFRQVWDGGLQGGIVRNPWRDLLPVAVVIDGDIALVYFEVTWQPSTAGGETRTVRSRRLTVFQRQNDEWAQIGGAIASIRPPIATAPTSTPAVLPDRARLTAR